MTRSSRSGRGAVRRGARDALAILEAQHRQVEHLFERIVERRQAKTTRLRTFARLADMLLVHQEMEERVLYPALAAVDRAFVLESAEEHLACRRLLADLLALDAGDATWLAKAAVLREQVEAHARKEEAQLFPRARKALGVHARLAVAQEMMAVKSELEDAEIEPRQRVFSAIERAAPV